MSRYWPVFLIAIGVCIGWDALAWTRTSARETTRLPTPISPWPDSVRARVARPKSLTFTASTDQRFFFFKDTRNDNGRRIPVGVYGLRAGFLFPFRHPRTAKAGAIRAAYKAGIGLYFVNQTLNRPGLLPATSEAVTRRLRIATAFFEPYLFRGRAIQVSLPVELGYGHSRYERNNGQSTGNEIARGVFLPVGVGVLASYRFPSLRWFRPLHWFGFNLLTGYRFIVKKDVPASQINYTGLYVSAGPSLSLENLTADLRCWRKKRAKK